MRQSSCASEANVVSSRRDKGEFVGYLADPSFSRGGRAVARSDSTPATAGSTGG
jgi:hypothetical protein